MRVKRLQLFCITCLITIIIQVIAFEFQISATSRMSVNKEHIKVLGVRKAQVAHPTGDPNFAVMQAFPAAFTAKECDPFLMCDAFGPVPSDGIETNPDKFQVQWHPHRGMDLLTYITQGVGRHADSMGNRGEFASPGMQWISAGSGIEHAEGGGTPLGENVEGFQIWVNVPSERKMDDPRYGTEPPENIPVIPVGLVSATDTSGTSTRGDTVNKSFVRVLAGEYDGHTGPFKTVTDVQILDFTLNKGVQLAHSVPVHLDNCLLYVYKGQLNISGDVVVGAHEIVRFDASDPTSSRHFTVTASESVSFLIFAGKMLKQPIAWHGPFVMTTDAEIKTAIREYQLGTFLKKRAAWDYKRISTKF